MTKRWSMLDIPKRTLKTLTIIQLTNTVELDLQTFRAASGKFNSKTDAEKLRTACLGKSAMVQSVSRKDRIEQPPKLYDLTML